MPTVTFVPTMLENRLLLSATPIDAALAGEAMTSDANAPQEPRSDAPAEPLRVVFVDSTVPNLQSMLQDLGTNSPDAEVFVLRSDRDGVDQITEVLQSRQDVQEVHLVSHGRREGLLLGDAWLGPNNLAAYAGQIASWRDALTHSADILFYGCDVAGTEAGQEFLESFSQLTLADVAASNDDTGHLALQANWELEYQIGDVESGVLVSQAFQQDWFHTLPGNSDPVGLPVVVGNAIEDSMLNVDTTGISDPDGMTSSSFQYQWLRGGTAISGATGSTYTLGDADVGETISVQVGFMDDLGTLENLTSASTSQVANINDEPTGGPEIIGIAAEHQTLSFDLTSLEDHDGLPSNGFIRWLRDGNPITGATDATYQLTAKDIGSQITVRITYLDNQGTIERVTSDPTATVVNTNDPPTLQDRRRSVPFGIKLFVGTRLFDRASDDPDGDPLTAVPITGPNVGHLDLNSDGSFIYTPDPEYIGVVTFEWAATDGTLTSDPAKVEIVIAPPIEPPGDDPSDNGDADDSDAGDSTADGSSSSQGIDPGASRDSELGDNETSRPTIVPDSFAPSASAGIGTTNRPSTDSGPSRPFDRTTQLILAPASSPSLDQVIETIDVALQVAPTETSSFAFTVGSSTLWERLDVNDEKLALMLSDDRLVAGSFGVATSGVTLVGLTWALRSGILLLGLYQQKPLWSRMDPLMLMQGLNHQEDESLADVMEQQRRRLDETPPPEPAGTE